MVTALCGSFCIACLRPLTRRYEASDSKNPRLICPRVVYLSSKRAIN
nr:hypothetical protein [Vibrio vulnificus]